MTIEHVRVVFHMEPTLLLVGVLRGAVQFQALQAGFKTETCAEIATASEDVCRETLAQLTDADGGLDVMLDTFADRIEVSILHGGKAGPAVGLETFAFSQALHPATGGISGLELLSRVDRVLYSSEDGKACTTLVKFQKSGN